jgi:hypothetical protein
VKQIDARAFAGGCFAQRQQHEAPQPEAEEGSEEGDALFHSIDTIALFVMRAGCQGQKSKKKRKNKK